LNLNPLDLIIVFDLKGFILTGLILDYDFVHETSQRYAVIENNYSTKKSACVSFVEICFALLRALP
jgi:hypothetical protein